jgi:Rps23 Pro-64 3,4-dihydroxylase Tpa1-like proline 4-hydroxylase
MSFPPFAINPMLDIKALAARFARDGRLHIVDFLAAETAAALHALLCERTDWRQVLNSGDRTVELDRETRAAMSEQQHAALDEAIYAAARTGFQYRYETIRVPDEEAARCASDDALASFASWLSSDAPRDFLRTVTGAAEIEFADAQATAYGPGDFLTGHDDAVAGRNRYAAYVLSLNPVWRTEWGGLLVFHAGKSGWLRAVEPGFNTLNLFRVPQMHSVSEVTRAAAYRRYSITGWLRRR